MSRSNALRMALVVAVGAWAGMSATARPPKPAAHVASDPRPRALTRHEINYRDWTIGAIVRLHSFQYRLDENDVYERSNEPTVLDAVAMVYPLIGGSAMHDAYLDRVSSEFSVGNVKLDLEPRTLANYQGGTMLGVWEAEDIHTTQALQLRVDIPMTCYETRIDEKIAQTYDWPAGDYKPMIASCLEPQLYIEPGHPEIQRLVQEWTKGNVRNAKPYLAAKFLAGKVVEHFQPTEGLYESAGRGPHRGHVTAVLLEGFNVHGAAYAAAKGEGSRFDIACLLTAVYRAAGIPARMVIGLDIKETREAELPVLRAWTEFYLYDEKAEAGEWIPVDVFRQREFSSRMPPLKQRWQFFGHNEEFDFVAPLSYHWLPPTALTNTGPPGIWGWIPSPGVPAVDAELSFVHNETAKRGDDPKEWWERPKQQPMQ